MSSSADERVLVLMPSRSDADRTALLLSESGLDCALCDGPVELCTALEERAGAVLVTEEMVASDTAGIIEACLRKQPPWSMISVLLVTRERSGDRLQYNALGGYGSVVIVERPVRTRSLVSALRSALRARRQQYAIRDAMIERDRQATEAAAQDEKLRFALSAGSLGSWDLDLVSGEIVCSDVYRANFGLPSNAPFDLEQLKQIIHPSDRQRAEAALATSLADGGKYDIEYRVVWPDREVRWVLVRGRPQYGAHGRPARMLGVSLDITERKRLQSELASQTEQLREGDRKKDEFIATLAHELRNPLAPIRAGLSLLEAAPVPDSALPTLAIMQRHVGHMVRLIDDLLDVSRITRGKLELRRARVSVASVVASAVEASLPNLDRGKHTLHSHISRERLSIDADHTRIAQVISNLLNNASKFTPAGGNVTLAVYSESDEVVIAVSDDGIGMPPDKIQQVFEMFSQLGPASDPTWAGLGIGLALVRKLVGMHGGSVRAESAGVGKGSTFTVRLPLVRSESIAAPLPAAVPFSPQAHDESVLVVDDNADAADLLSLLLQGDGYASTTAYDGPTAIAAARASTPDLLILDIGLPGMSGYEVAQELRKDPRFEHTGMIALTGWGTPDDRQRALSSGFDVHLTKPVNREELSSALRAVARKRARPPQHP